MSLSLPSSLSKVGCVVLPVRCPLGTQSQSVCPESFTRAAPDVLVPSFLSPAAPLRGCAPFTAAVFHPRGSCVPVLRTEMMIYDCRVFH